MDTAQTHPFRFTGDGREYFRIWIVNLALSLLTLGIYSAWAKVRRQQYFYRNTHLAGGSFDYHGDPVAILKGRLIGVGLFVAYNVAAQLDVAMAMAVLVVLILLVPWLIQRSLCFRLGNSSYRGLRFRFDGSVGGAYVAYLLWPALGFVTLGLLVPLGRQRITAWQHGSSRYGTAPFGFNAGPGGFYLLYLQLVLLLALVLILALFLGGGMDVLALLGHPYISEEQRKTAAGLLVLLLLAFYLAAMLLIGPWFAARMQNLVWNGTALAPHAFASRVKAGRLLAIYLTNFLGIVLTLGLFKPFADIRAARYRLECLALNAEGSLDDFVAGQARPVSATGEETAEVFDVDISL